MSDAIALGAEMAANACVYAAVLLALGVCTARWWIRFELRAHSTVERLDQTLTRAGLATAAFAAAALTLRLWTHTLAVFGSSSWEQIATVALESQWGRAWRIQSLAAIALVGIYLWMRVRPSGWIAATLLAAVFCGTMPLVGHGAASTPRALLHALHVLGAGIWIGTLAVIVLAGGRDQAMQMLLRRFAKVALTGVVLVAMTGMVAASLYVRSIADFWATGYGRALSAKVMVVMLVALLGWMNWRRFSSDTAHSRRLPALEVATAGIVVLLTSVLVQLERP